MKILLVYPETPSTFWSFRHALKFIAKKSTEPPLGLLTVAALLPERWEKRLVDMNVTKLKDRHLRWADYVFLSGMNIHIDSFRRVIKRCNELGAKVVAGGPLATTEHQQFLGVDHFVLGEAENIMPQFVDDMKNGEPKPMYSSTEFPDITKAVIPQWELLDRRKYSSMSMQYSRGCPYDCEFCSVTLLNGHKPRTKRVEQFLSELDELYALGWRGAVAIVDDNFIGNKRQLKSELLPALIRWQKKYGYPFLFSTEASINLADDEVLVSLLVKSGINTVFIGIETPSEKSLSECAKKQNLQRNLLESVKRLQRRGLIVHGGFIVGFDNDPQSIFEDQIEFIQKSGIVTAMVGLLTALSGTHLFNRLKSENRLLNQSSGNNMDGSVNFVPRMNYKRLMSGYKFLLTTIYAQKDYYERVRTFLREYKMPAELPVRLTFSDIRAFFRSLWVLGVLERGRSYFWRLLLFVLRECPEKFSLAVTLAIYGFHFRRVIRTV